MIEVLGKASEIKTISIETYSSSALHELINKWLIANPDVILIDIKHGLSINENERAEAALIIYKEGESA